MTRSAFVEGLGFEPDRFQIEAFDALDAGSHVIVAAPTGAGKTLVAAYAVDRAIADGTRVFYTTPIKALSNQKYHDFVAAYGAENVGLLTGDNSINGEAPVVVMTTEVLRNMLYAGRTLDRLQAVVLDEVHYLQDSYRGPVWEEVIIHLPRSVQLVALSATVSNAGELAEWMGTVRGDTALVVETRRPVELENHYLVAERGGPKLHMIRTLVSGKANDKGFRFDPDHRGGAPRGAKGRGNSNRRKDQRHRPRAKWRTPGRVDIVDELRRNDLLPAIFFIFSRAGCAEAAAAVRDAGLVMTSKADRKQIREIADEHVQGFDAASLELLGYEDFLAALLSGVAPHHAGMVPPLKETVEACFVRGLTKVVFATETLALGINMPARTVVIDKLTKFTGEHHEALTPAQYTQLTGRAGRRGIDTHGQAVVLWSPFVQFEQVANLAASKEYVLRSAFRPTYNMAANLVRRYDEERARQLLNLSFAQFRVDADVVRGAEKLERLRDRKHQQISRLEAEYGPIDELRAAVETRVEASADLQDVSFALSQIKPGQILEVDGAVDGHQLPSPVTAISVAYRKGRRIKVVVVDDASDTYEINATSLNEPPTVLGAVELPEPYLPHSMTFIHDVSQAMVRARLVSAKRRKRLGPGTSISSVLDVPPAARKGLKRIDKIDAQIENLVKNSNKQSESLGRQFERVVDLLEDRGHLDGWALTDTGQRLARLYHECDLLLIEALDEGLFDGLSAPEISALASAFAFEDRRLGPAVELWYPSRELRRRFGALTRIHNDLAKAEKHARLPITREPDAGFMAMAHGWASGGDLSHVLEDEEITAGDFVRTAKLLIDLLRQIAQLAPVPDTGRAAARAADAVFRDLVAASSIVEPDEPAPDDTAPDGPEADADQQG